jgi:hypothetical protein
MTMNTMPLIKGLATLAFGLVFGPLLAQPAHAGGPLSQDEVKALLSGNTVSGKHEKGRYSFQSYFAPDGVLRQVRDNGEKLQGSWMVRSDGDLCANFGEGDVCGPILPLGGGQYKRMQLNPRNVMAGDIHLATILKVEPGNPGGL